ncbi:cell wall anchor protein, partial [bacterium c-19]|nr:cell wall anchor protein [bacterium c-19]
KKDANSGKVVKKSGVEFDIFKKDGSANGTYIATIATNSQGVALYKNLRYGDYYFVEKTQPPKYYISNERINFQIREDKVKIQKTLSNPQIRGKIILTKEDCEVGKRPQGDGTLDGAIYTLYAQEDILDPADDSVKIKAGTEVMTATIKDYTATFDNLYLGKYRIKETKPPKKGYLLDGKDYIVNLTDTEHIKTVTSCD